MQPDEPEIAAEAPQGAAALIVSEVRFLRGCLAEILHRAPGWVVLGECATLAHALDAAHAQRPAIMLLDAAFPSGRAAAASLAAANPDGSVVALAVVETEAAVLGWAEAGAKGYVPNTASAGDLVALIEQIARGEQTCASHIAGSLLRRVAATARAGLGGGMRSGQGGGQRNGQGSGRGGEADSVPPPTLTGREIEILRLVGGGLSNKDIARRLGVSLGTTKTHVHNLLGKLQLQRRSEVMLSMHARHAAGIDLRPPPDAPSPFDR